jgi:hypothetical protein
VVENLSNPHAVEALKILLLGWFATELRRLRHQATDAMNNCTLIEGAGLGNGETVLAKQESK